MESNGEKFRQEQYANKPDIGPAELISSEPVNTSRYTKTDIQRFWQGISFGEFSTPFDYYLKRELERNEGLFKAIREHLTGRHLVDLGCGGNILHDGVVDRLKEENFEPALLMIARECGCSGYTGVDLSEDMWRIFGDEVENPNRTVTLNEVSNYYEFPVQYAHAEMLDFINSLPDDSVCFTMNGIDSEIIYPVGSGLLTDTDYYQALIEEITRTTVRDGIIFGDNAGILYPTVMERAGWQELSDIAKPQSIKAFLKSG